MNLPSKVLGINVSLGPDRHRRVAAGSRGVSSVRRRPASSASSAWQTAGIGYIWGKLQA